MLKKLSKGLLKKGGRNNLGRICVFTKSGGHKRLYRFIDFKQNLLNIKARVIKIEYDPNRSSFIALVLYQNGVFSYIVASDKMKEGDFILTSLFYNNLYSDFTFYKIPTFYRLPIASIPVGASFFNVELNFGNGAQISRSAGTSCILLKKLFDKNLALIKLPSSEYRMIPLNCFVTLGVSSNIDHKLKKLYKAGQSRWLGRKPSVRGVAMNPIDHPHGGGQGKTSGGRPSVTPWGWYTKGQRTRSKHCLSSKYIIRRRLPNPRKYLK